MPENQKSKPIEIFITALLAAVAVFMIYETISLPDFKEVEESPVCQLIDATEQGVHKTTGQRIEKRNFASCDDFIKQ